MPANVDGSACQVSPAATLAGRTASWLRDEEAICEAGRSAGLSDGNREGNDRSRQRPDAAVDSHVLSRVSPQLGIRYT